MLQLAVSLLALLWLHFEIHVIYEMADILEIPILTLKAASEKDRTLPGRPLFAATRALFPHIGNTRIVHPGSKAQDHRNSKNHGL